MGILSGLTKITEHPSMGCLHNPGVSFEAVIISSTPMLYEAQIRVP